MYDSHLRAILANFGKIVGYLLEVQHKQFLGIAKLRNQNLVLMEREQRIHLSASKYFVNKDNFSGYLQSHCFHCTPRKKMFNFIPVNQLEFIVHIHTF